MFADISFTISSYQVFTYKIRNNLKSHLSIGMRVKAPLGSRNVKGIIVDIKKTTNFVGSIKSIKEMVDDMKSGDYINLLKILDKNFGSVVVMETNNKEYLEALS